MHVFDFVKRPPRDMPRVLALFGGESFLQRQALRTVRDRLTKDGEPPLGRTFDGDQAEWRDVCDDVATVSLFGQGQSRLVVVDRADKFVTANRPALEAYAKKPKRTGVLVLMLDQLASNTKLFKAVDALGGIVHCGAPQKKSGRKNVEDAKKINDWLVEWCQSQHQAKLLPKAALLLTDLRGIEFGLLDQELAKLALYVGVDGTITEELVNDVVGGWKSQSIWDLLDAALDGDVNGAMLQLDRLLHGGEPPIALFGQLAWSVRRFAAATHLFERNIRQGKRQPLRQVLTQAGFREWPQGQLERAERQIKRMGRRRGAKLYRWLLELDLALKGSHSSPDRARFAIEHFVLRLAAPAGAA